MGDQIRILYAEDNWTFRLALTQAFERLGVFIQQFVFVADAQEEFKAEPYDLVVLDGTTLTTTSGHNDGWRWAYELWEHGQAVLVFSTFNEADKEPRWKVLPFIQKSGSVSMNDVAAEILGRFVAGELTKK